MLMFAQRHIFYLLAPATTFVIVHGLYRCNQCSWFPLVLGSGNVAFQYQCGFGT